MKTTNDKIIYNRMFQVGNISKAYVNLLNETSQSKSIKYIYKVFQKELPNLKCLYITKNNEHSNFKL